MPPRKQQGQGQRPQGGTPAKAAAPPPAKAAAAPAAAATAAAPAARAPTQPNMPPVTPAKAVDVVPAGSNSYIRNIDIGASAYALAKSGGSKIPPRPKELTKLGREIDILLNTFPVLKIPSKKIYQYDVHIGNGAERRGFMNLLWNCKEVSDWRAKHGKAWIWDGAALAWATEPIPDGVIQFSLDPAVCKGLKGKEGKETKHLRIRFAKVLDMNTLHGWLQGKSDIDETVLEAMSFLDHLIRETPSQNLIRHKRSFFPPQALGKSLDNDVDRYDLGNGVLAVKGIFMSLRAVLQANMQPGLCINVDVANTCFWDGIELQKMITSLLVAPRNEFSHVQRMFQETNRGPGHWKKSRMYQILKRLRKVGIVARYRGQEFRYIINDWIPLEPSEVKFQKDGKEISVTSHMRAKWDFTPLRWSPTIETTKKALIPIDSCYIEPNQRYPFKLSERQTSEMIKFVVTPPSERLTAVRRGVGTLNWRQDQVLTNYGMSIDTNATKVKARLLNPPDVLFKQGKVTGREAQSGRWRIDGKTFLEPNKRPIQSWGFCIVKRDDGRGATIHPNDCMKFFNAFKRIYAGHGGVLSNEVMSKPIPHVQATPGNGRNLILWTWNATGTAWSREPDILFFIVPGRDSDTYKLIKRSCDLRYGVPSQVLQAMHVGKCQDQYISNVCMKVNAKLGGATCRAVEPNGYLSKFSSLVPYNRNITENLTMVIGADVSHGAPGTEDGSMAAVTVSQDIGLTKYAAFVNTNGDHREMISTENWNYFLEQALPEWRSKNNGFLPRRVIYCRDGVSEAEYNTVLSEEVRDIKAAFAKSDPNNKAKFTVLIATKRHHVRFFPAANASSRNGNPLPGTLVETGATHPFEHDWYLCTHAAIKGTARPMHYYTILNENNLSGSEMQQMLFEQCFQYARATTPVSMHPAIYYAHLAAKRAEAHVDQPFMSGPKQDPKAGPGAVAPPNFLPKQSSAGSSLGSEARGDIRPLHPIMNNRGFAFSAWYM